MIHPTYRRYVILYEENIFIKIHSLQSKITDFTIYGDHVQPYPSKRCLSPIQSDTYKVALESKYSNSLYLRMPTPKFHEDCKPLRPATVIYTIIYGPLTYNSTCMELETCNIVTTARRLINIDGLKTFTRYSIWVKVSNHFSEDNVTIGRPVILQTGPGGK